MPSAPSGPIERSHDALLYCAGNMGGFMLRCNISPSEAPRQAQHVLSNIAQDQVGADRSDLVQPGFTELALDVVFVGEAEAAVELQAGVGGLPGRLRGEVFRHVG